MKPTIDSVVHKTQWRLVPFMLTLYILAFLDRSNIGFAKQSYQLDTGLSSEVFALGAGIFFVAYAFLGAPANLLMRKFGAKTWIGFTTILWAILSTAMAFTSNEFEFLLVRFLLGAAEAGFFPGMIYLASQWFPSTHRGKIMGLFYMGAPIALTFGSPLSGMLLKMHGFAGHPGWFWMFVIEGIISLLAGIFTFVYLENSPKEARFLSVEEREILIDALHSEEENKNTSKISDALGNGKVWLLSIIYMIIQITVYGLVFFLPTQVAELLGTDVGLMSSLVTAIPWMAAIVGTYYIPRYSDRTGNRVQLSVFTLLLSAVGIAVSVLTTPVIAIIALSFAAIGFIAVQPIFWTIPTSILSGAALAAGIGFINMFGAFGGFLAPIIKVYGDNLFNNPIAGLMIISIITFIGCALIATIKMPKTTQSKE